MDYKAQREPGQRHSKQNIKPDRTKDNMLKPNDQTYGERVDDRLENGCRELSDLERRSQDGWKQRYNLGRYHQGKKCKSGVERGLRG